MKCTVCGENNVENARFCSFCGAKLDSTRHLPVVEGAHADREARDGGAETAQPLGDNPIQPARRAMPRLYAERPTATADYTVVPPRAPQQSALTPDVGEADSPAASRPAAPVRPQADRLAEKPPKKVFLFDDELEEEKQKKWEEEDKKRKEAFRKKHSAPDDELFYDEEDEEYGEDYEDEDPRGGRVFIKVISILTVLVLVAAIAGFLFATSLGGRLRAQWGLSWNYEDYLNLADWQQRAGNLAGASDSYLNAFKLKDDDYDVSLRIAYGFENCGDASHAESMYAYLIKNYPNRDEPYDHLMALLYTQGRLSEYEALLTLRAQNQPGYQGTTAYQPPVADPASGSYTGEVSLTLTAEKALEIRYTLDDSQPTAQSLLYTGPIILGPGSHSIRAVAVYEGGRLGEEWRGFYTVLSGS